MPRALITGITGQDGMYLAEFLSSKDYEVFGLIRGQNNPKRERVLATLPGVSLIPGDLTDLSSLVRTVELAQPDEVYNLAAISHVGYSWSNPHLTSNVTGLGVLNVLEAIRMVAGGQLGGVRFYQASSSEMFGQVSETPQTESTRILPRSPYGVAKAFGHHITINYRESYGMHASSGILFNHESPRRGPEFVTRKVSLGVARLALGLQSELRLGNLNAIRDWGFAGDYVEAMWRMLQQDEPGDYVIATGQSHSIRDLLTEAFKAVGISDWRPFVRQDSTLFRPADVDRLTGNADRARTALGWKPTMDFHELIQSMVRADLAKLSANRRAEG